MEEVVVVRKKNVKPNHYFRYKYDYKIFLFLGENYTTEKKSWKVFNDTNTFFSDSDFMAK